MASALTMFVTNPSLLRRPLVPASAKASERLAAARSAKTAVACSTEIGAEAGEELSIEETAKVSYNAATANGH